MLIFFIDDVSIDCVISFSLGNFLHKSAESMVMTVSMKPDFALVAQTSELGAYEKKEINKNKCYENWLPISRL